MKSKFSGTCILFGGFLACAVCFAAGVVVGYFSQKSLNASSETPAEVDSNQPTGQVLQSPVLRQYDTSCQAEIRKAKTCQPDLPRHYTAFYLKDQNIRVDGKLDDPAWKEVPWTEDFVDIRGFTYPTPSLATHVKIRWDDNNVYVGAYLQETKPWATYTKKDSRIYEENAFEVFFDVDGSMSMYKEIEINVLNTTWDLMLSRAYIDGGDFSDWEGIAAKGVHTDGEPNNASIPATFWSLELAFPFSALNENTSRTHGTAQDGEVWFMILARPQYQVEAVNGTFVQKPGTEASWYSWNPMGAINLHLPSRWGLLLFSKDRPSMKPAFKYNRWIVYKTLFDIFEAEKAFQAVNGMYIDNKQDLNLPPYITAGCLLEVKINVGGGTFTATVTSHEESSVEGHINENRHVWFTNK